MNDTHATPQVPETLNIGIGQPLEISVGPTEARNGYVWLMRGLPECLALESTHDELPTNPAHGRMASRVFRVVGCHQGDGLIHCVLARPWNPDEVVDERRFRLVVSANHSPSP